MTYLETLGKLQAQSLDALKAVQATHLAALATVAEAVADSPALKGATAFENLPTFSELVELNAAFAHRVLEQQNEYATKLSTIFTAK